MLLAGALGIAAPGLHLLQPSLEALPGFGEPSLRPACAHDFGEGRAGHDEVLIAGEIAAIDAVAKDEAVISVPERETLSDALDGLVEPAAGALQLLGETLLLGNVAGRAHHAIGPAAGVAQREAVLAR